MNANQAIDRIGEILGILYWHERGSIPVNNPDELEQELEEIKAGLNADKYLPETNERGAIIERAFLKNGERYIFDFDLKWPQFDTCHDAWYFGIWVNPETLQVLTYAEGDLVLTNCTERAVFEAELEALWKFYKEQPPALVAINDKGEMIEFRDKRPTAEQAPETAPGNRLNLAGILEKVKR
jgi:hypothetical protein